MHAHSFESPKLIVSAYKQKDNTSTQWLPKDSLRSKRFQLSYCAKVRAGAKTKMEGGRGGKKRKRLPANPTILENAPWNFAVRFICKLTARQHDRFKKITFFPETGSTRLQNVLKRSFTIKECSNSKRLLQNFLFFIVKWNFESSVAFSQLKPCRNVAKKLFVRKNSLRRLWVLQSGCSP